MSNIHFIMQPKGGVGKSWVSALLAQYLKSKQKKISCADTDPKTPTFINFKSLNVAYIEIFENGKIKQAKFDSLIESMLANDCEFVVDTGGNTFIDLKNYLLDNSIFDTLHESNKKVFIHCPLTGGQALQKTIEGFTELLNIKSNFFKIVIWENEFYGPVGSDSGLAVESDLYLNAVESGKVLGSVKIKDRKDSDSYVADLTKMTTNSFTLDDVNSSTDFNLMAKRRMHTVVNDVFAELDKIPKLL